MVKLLKRLTDLSTVPSVMQGQTSYSSTRNGFATDRNKLRNDVKKVTSELNRNIQRYGNQKYAS